jgi:hypothetical protein
MAIEAYLAQILITVAKGCKPESPIEDRAWVSMKPPYGLTIAPLRPALDALVSAGLLTRDKGSVWRVKPSRVGYAFVESWKEDRRAMKTRPILFAPVIPEPPTILDQRQDRYCGYNHLTHLTHQAA